MKSYPPFLDQIHQHCPKAAFLYTLFWREKDEENRVHYEKKKITDEYAISWKSFNNDLRLLKKEKVIKYSFNSPKDKITIHLMLPNSIEKAA